jgi:hypothetical protein
VEKNVDNFHEFFRERAVYLFVNPFCILLLPASLYLSIANKQINLFLWKNLSQDRGCTGFVTFPQSSINGG